MCPCRLASADDAGMGRALQQLPRLASLKLGRNYGADLVEAARVEGGGWRVDLHEFLTPDAVSVLASCFSSGAERGSSSSRQQRAATVGQQLADEQGSSFDAAVTIPPQGHPSGQTSQLASLGRALAAFDDVVLGLHCDGVACPAGAHALLQPVAARLCTIGVWRGAASGVVEALGRLALPRLMALTLAATRGVCDPGVLTAVAGLDAPCLASVILGPAFSGSRADVVAAVSALAVGRPRPVGPDGRLASLEVAVSGAALSDEELGSVCRALPTTRSGWVTVARPSS